MRILSGVQPTGNLHLGNYLGAIRHWVSLQNSQPQAERLFCIVDLHAITVPQEPVLLRKHVLETAAAYLACGIDPEKSLIFPQSLVSGHAELAWLLGCGTPLGWLNRMTQFKEKAGKQKENAGMGLYTYPVLMAADILLYRTTHVPVGEDQKQHLELTRDIATKFNHDFNCSLLTLPEPMILGEAARVMSLRDGTKKMSKSDESDYSRITLSDDAETIAQKIRKSKTDPDALPSSVEELASRPEAKNLLTIYGAVTGGNLETTVNRFAGVGFGVFKQELTDALVQHLHPISTAYRAFLEDKEKLSTLLLEHGEGARALAAPLLKEIKEQMGFLCAL